jgi:hypothetical protein
MNLAVIREKVLHAQVLLQSACLAYSIGALAAKHNVWRKLCAGSPSMRPELEIAQTERTPGGRVKG